MKEDINMGKRLYGKVTKENAEYEWKAEPGACEVCRAMDGTIYESANDIPDRPHPNCKCWIDVLEKDKDTTDPIELYKEKRKDRKRNELELAKLLGDAKSLEEEIDEYITQINKQEKEIKELESKIDINRLDIKNKWLNLKEQLQYTKYVSKNLKHKIISTLKDIDILQKNILYNTYNSDFLNKIDKIYFNLKILQEELDNYLKKQFDKSIDLLDKLMPISTALWKLSTTKFKDGIDYINKNGKIYKTIHDIKDERLKAFIQNKIAKQMHVEDSRGIVFNANSEMSKKITESAVFRKYIKEKRDTFKPNTELPDISVTFDLLNLDMYNAMHRADITDIKIGNDMTFYAKVIDTYDFNKGSKNPLVMLARHYQEKNKIENYYIITKIKIHQSEWIRY